MKALSLVTVALLVCAGVGEAQPQRPKSSLGGKLKGALKGAVDSAATQAASATVDSLLGTGDTQLVGGHPCPPGTTPAGGADNTVGDEVVGKLKKQIAGGKKAAVQPAPTCIPNPAAQAAMLQAQVAAQQAAAQQASAAMAAQTAAGLASQAAAGGAMSGGAAKALAAATPVGMAVVAAPVAMKGVKALGGLFGKGQNKESMIKDLSKGRLELKGVKFIGASDALEEGFDDDLAALAEALQAIEGDFILNIPAEVDDDAEPDTVMARRRLEKLSAQLAVVGIAEGRLALESHSPGLDPKKKAPKPGEAKVEILRKPAEPKQ